MSSLFVLDKLVYVNSYDLVLTYKVVFCTPVSSRNVAARVYDVLKIVAHYTSILTVSSLTTFLG